MRLAPPIAVALARARALGALLDVSAALLLGLAVGHALGHGRLGTALGAVGGLVLALRDSPLRAARALQHARPQLGSALEAYLEGQGGTLRPRLEAWVVERLGPAWPWAGLGRFALAAALALASLARPPPREAQRPPTAVAAPALSVTARLLPPAYTGWPSVPVTLPSVRGLRHSQLLLEVRTTATRLSWAENGGGGHVLSPTGGQATLALPLERTGSVRLSVEGDGPVVVLSLEALPDAPPRVTLDVPQADMAFAAAPGRLALRASAEDDVRVAHLGFQWTLARGHAEGMRFSSGRLSGRVRLEGQRAEATSLVDPVALGMKAGDTLVVWAEATDSNPVDGPGQGRSEARLLRWDEALADVSQRGTGARLPPASAEPTERELLQRTERLLRAGGSPATRRAQSAELALVQRHIRESFGFFLQQESSTGLELDVEAAEVAESGDARGRRLLAQAVSEMWTAEAELSMGNPARAVAPERAAVKALEAALGSERFALRPLRPPDKPVEEARRLSGVQTGLRPAALGLSAESRPDTSRVEGLARRLLLSAEQPLTAEAARQLADALWALPQKTGIPAPSLAAPLYAAEDVASRSDAARAAGVALSRWLRPSPEGVPPMSEDETSVLVRLPPAP